MIAVLVVLISAFALLAVVFQFVRRMGQAPEPEPTRYPFEARAPLTEREQRLYWRLRRALPGHVVLSQVGLSRMLRVESGHDLQWLNRVNRMTIDFVICREDGTILGAIELEDDTPPTAERVAADARKTKALESAGVRLVRLKAEPDEAALARLFAS